MTDYDAQQATTTSAMYISAGFLDSRISSQSFAVGTTTVSTSYKMRGYYVAGAIFEYWITTNTASAPPSGHTLEGIEYTILR